MNYKQSQYGRAIDLIKKGVIFNKDKGNGVYRGKERAFILNDSSNNLYSKIYVDCVNYFKYNKIAWWGGNLTNHTLSSQVACLNHLFLIRNNKEAVLNIVKQIEPRIIDVFKITTDKFMPAFIQFEATSDVDHLNEMKSSRGSNCTSIDALIYGKHEDGRKIIFLIEWKYVECYANNNKGEGKRGVVRKKRYNELISKSEQLNANVFSVCYYEPFYQLMRQTLWAEQLIRAKDTETIKADDYIHIHVIPDQNNQLLNKKYKCSGGKDMEDTWRECINMQEKYVLCTPQQLLGPIDSVYYKDLICYLKERYWK